MNEILKERKKAYRQSGDALIYKVANNSIATIAKQLNEKDNHFILEIIQNADDNPYEEKIVPSLKLIYSTVNIEHENRNAVIICNNETGFERDHVEAICSVDESTKKLDEDSTGEKGIGFKSVFRITDCPYVFSNEFNFKLPEYEDIGDGEKYVKYITPHEVFDVPKKIQELRKYYTTIIVLPIDESKPSAGKVQDMLLDIDAKTILFLRKLRKIEVEIEENGKLVSQRIVEREDSNEFCSDVHQKTTLLKTTMNGKKLETTKLFVYRNLLQKPSHITHEKRLNAETREIQIGISLDKVPVSGLFAFLPVYKDTGLPFLMQTDFILTADRRSILVDLEWNKWLHGEIVQSYIDAIQSLINSNINIKEKLNLYHSIPTATSNEFLQPIVKEILVKLKNEKIIYSFETKKFFEPINIKSTSEQLLSILKSSKKKPECIQNDRNPLVSDLIDFGKLRSKLTKIGIDELRITDLINHYFLETSWMKENTADWFTELYNYLRNKKFENEKLDHLKIIKVKGKAELQSSETTNLYFKIENRQEVNELLGDYKEQINIDELNNEYLDFFLKTETAEKKKWLTSALWVHDFTLNCLAVDLINKMNSDVSKLSAADILRMTEMVYKLDPDQLRENSVPLVLNTNQVQDSKSKAQIAVPEGFEEFGWKYIFVFEDDRTHFKVLSSEYKTDVIKVLLTGESNLKRFPNLQVNEISYYGKPVTPSGNKLKRELILASAEKWLEKITGFEILLPDHFTSKKNPNFSLSILNFIDELYIDSNSEKFRLHNWDYLVNIGIMIKGRYENRGYNRKYLYSEFHHFITATPWLYTNDIFGFQVPSSVFLDKPEIREVFGDSVPYISNISNIEVLKLLGVQTSITKASLIHYLEQLRNSPTGMDIEIVKSIYHQLDERLRNSPFSEHEIPKDVIFVPETGWKSHDECVWENTDGMDDANLISIGQIYPELESFFVNKLFVPKRLSLEYYITRWQTLQKENSPTKKQVTRIYRALKEHIEGHKVPQEFMEENELYLFRGDMTTDEYLDFKELIFPDDKKLSEIFDGFENMVFFPREDGFATWQNFFDSLEVKRLTQKVEISILEDENSQEIKQNKFLTNSCILLMAAFLKSKSNIYQNFLESGIFKELLEVKEFFVEDDHITLKYELEDTTETNPAICCFEMIDEATRLFYCKNTERHHVAQEIFRILKNVDDELPNLFKEKIENYLEAKTTQRIKEEGLKDPIEVEEIIEKIKNVPSVPEIKDDEPQEPEKDEGNDNDDDDGNQEPFSIDVDENTIEFEKPKRTEVSVQTNNQPIIKPPAIEIEIEEPIFEPTPKTLYAEPKVESIDEIDQHIGTSTKSDEEKALLEQKKLQTAIEKLNTELKNSRYKELGSKKSKTLERFSFGWLKELTKLECLLEQNKNSAQSYYYTFSTIRFENDVVYLGNSDRLVSNNIEELENLRLEVYGIEKRVTITLESVSVNGYNVRAKLAKSEDKNVIDFATIQKARIKVENRSFIWFSVQTLIDSLKDTNELAIEKSAKREGISYIYGPPGTGKTQNIVQNQLIQDKSTKKSKILILAPTNKAADVITERLIDSNPNFTYFRFGNTNSEKIEKHKCFVGSRIEEQDKPFTLITSTARYFYAQLWENQMIMDYEWDKIIIDEASMINLAQIFGVILKTSKKTKIVIAGDPHQIQPIVSAEDWKNTSVFDVIGLTDFSAENRQKWKNQVTFLTSQYRSVQSIGDLYSKFCYSGFVDTKAVINKSSYIFCNNMKLNRLNLVTYPVVQNSHLFQPKYLNNSSYHLYLALLIHEWISVFTKQFENNPKTIGIISPYRAQSDLLQKLIHSGSTSHHGCQIIVSTVHSFQGDECDIIVCAFNPPNKGHENNAINNKNIINVAISRAKEHLILFMPYNYQKYPNLKELSSIFSKSIAPKTNVTADELELALFGEVDKIEQMTYSTARHPINVFGNSDYRYEIRIEEDALDIQVNTN